MANSFDPMEINGAANPSTSDEQERPNNDVGKDMLGYIERIERLEDEKSTLGDDIKSVKAEYKSKGYDTKMLAEMLRLRKMEKADREEWENLRDTYGHAIGIFG
jgi:uncharacterized protein (UPF0335 family)